MPDASIREAKERVRIAIKNSGIEFPNKRITVNLAPADTRKEGATFDLAIATGILSAIGLITCNNLDSYIFIGELSLDGSIRNINGILPMCIEAKKLKIPNIIIPDDNSEEACLVNDINIFPVKNLSQVICHLNNINSISPKKHNPNIMLNHSNINTLDFAEVKGQSSTKRALEIVAAGRT